jgi:hypothetical protein
MSNQRIALQTDFAADAEGLKNVSLITVGLEAAGHGIYLDDKTAETAMKRLLGRSVKSYLKHDGAGGDRLGQEIGFFSGVYRAGQQIKATAFQFLESFRKDAGAVADRLIEMAQKAPDQFGVSLVLEYSPVWVMPDGNEVQASRGEPAPEGALYGMPVMRVLDVISADFVGRPAANPNGLLSADASQPVVEANSQSTELNKMDSDTPAAATAETTSLETVTTAASTTAAVTVVDVAALAAKDGEIAVLAAKLADAEKAHVAALAEKDAKLTELSATLATGEDELVGALDELEQAEARIAELANFDARKLGIPPLRIASMQAAQAAAALSTPQQLWEHYQQMPDGIDRINFAAKHFNVLRDYSATLSAAK